MKFQIPTLTPVAQRRIYLIALAALALLVSYHLIDPGQVPLWADLVGALFGMTAPAVGLPVVNQKIAADKLAKR